MTRDQRWMRYAAISWFVVSILAAFVVGDMVGRSRSECIMVENHRKAFMQDGLYWGSSMRTIVEECDRYTNHV
jgi:hypothetical protein